MSTPKHQTKIGIDSTRAIQLRAIAEHHGVTVSSLIDEFTRKQWVSIGKSDLPGFTVERTNDHIQFRTDNGIGALLSIADARNLAQAIGHGLIGKSSQFTTAIGETFIIARKGRGLMIVYSKGDEFALKRGLSKSLAADLGNLLLLTVNGN